MMNDRFAILEFAGGPNSHTPEDLLDDENDMPDIHDVLSAEDMPNHLHFTAAPDYPDDHIMLDCIGNTEDVIPISPRLKKFLESKKIPNLLFIPVDMLDHKERVIEQYYLLHSLKILDVIDTNLTELEVDDLNEDMFDSVMNLSLHEKLIPSDIHIFRVKGLYGVTCVSKELAKEIDDNGFTGMRWLEIADYTY